MGKTLGIIGGGQLGLMLAEAAEGLEPISGVVVLDPTPDCPASRAGAEQIVGGFRDRDAIKRLADRADIITYEIESGDSQTLSEMQSRAQVSPSPATLKVIQDKLLQKRLLRENGIAVADFADTATEEDLARAGEKFGYPLMLKARRDGYDGRGNFLVGSRGQIGEAWGSFGGRALMAERLVPFDMEVSVIAARSTTGQIATYPVVENMHEDSILRTTLAPARTGPGVAEEASRLAERVLRVLQGAGVFGIEMFVAGGEVLVNEIAPRVHNSGHHTLQSSKTSQFEQHLRAITGMELGSTELVHPAIMYNVLGRPGYEGPYTVAEPQVEGAHLKMYGKAVSKPGRKIGHVNIVAGPGESLDDLLPRLEQVRSAEIARPV